MAKRWAEYLPGPQKLSPLVGAWAMGSHPTQQLLHAYSTAASQTFSGGDVFTIDVNGPDRPRTLGSLWNRAYSAAVRVDSLGAGFAIEGGRVFRFDLQSGATELVGSDPIGGATGVTYDPERNLLGFLKDHRIRWSGPQFPKQAKDTTDLGGAAFGPHGSLARDPQSGLYYACGPAGLSSIAIGAGSAVVIPLSPLPGAATVRDLAFRAGGLYAATSDQRLYRIDITSGEWSDLGRTSFAVSALY